MPEAARDAGLAIPLRWRVDKEGTEALKATALAMYLKNEYGRSRERIVFRATDLGNVAAYRESNGEPGGCARKVFFSFHADRFPARARTAEEVLNFAKGDESESKAAERLSELGWLVERQVPLGAWVPCRRPEACSWKPGTAGDPPCGVKPYLHADPRYPDRSGGLARGKADFAIKHPQYGLMPLDWKSASDYAYGIIAGGKAKGDNSLQAHFYGVEMGTRYTALGYEDKENGDLVILVAETDTEAVNATLERAAWLRDLIQRGELPPVPEGANPAQPADPPGSRRSGFRTLPDEPYFDRAWPCYTYSAKKDRVTACPFYEYCHGALPERPPPRPKAARKPAARAKPRGKSITFGKASA